MPDRPCPDDRSFDLAPGRTIGTNYVVESFLGAGWEGEVYRVVDRRTGSRRAAKLFFPDRNVRDRALDFYARKLEQLADCPLVIRYHHAESIRHRGRPTTVLISEYVEGQLLEDLVATQRGGRLPVHEALTILHGLAAGLETIHERRDYHGDLHAANIMVRRRGIRFDLKLVDLYDLGRPTVANRLEDVVDAVLLLPEMLGGPKWAARQQPEIRWIVAGRRRATIGRRFPTARALREHLESFTWESDRSDP